MDARRCGGPLHHGVFKKEQGDRRECFSRRGGADPAGRGAIPLSRTLIHRLSPWWQLEYFTREFKFVKGKEKGRTDPAFRVNEQ